MSIETGIPGRDLGITEDDVPRLIFADWLEEHGADERAELHSRAM